MQPTGDAGVTNNMPGTDAPEPLIGQTLGNYRIVRLLGQGGMASVYVGHQASMHRDAAIKIMRPDLMKIDPTFYTRFEREAQTTAALEHLQILPVYDFGKEGDYVYLAMRLMDGSLARYIHQKYPLPYEEVSRILSQIAAGLDYAHQCGVIHRDLKPDNILMDKQTNCCLADFGIA